MIITIELERGIRMILKFKKGFSLVELLVVIAIIGILAAVGITAYGGYTANAKIKVTSAQHGQVVALINAEFAKCASGSGVFPWSGSCLDDIDHADVVAYFDLTTGEDGAGTIQLPNAYNNQVAAVSQDIDDSGTALTVANEPVTEDGQIAIFCVASISCQVKTDTGEGDNLDVTINRY